MTMRIELGSLRAGQFGAVGNALRAVMRNPIAAALMAAGAGWLIYGMRKSSAPKSWRRRTSGAREIPVLNTGHARIYDPDASPLHPTWDSLESRREMSARV
jgi:hypothetical protein